MTLFFKRVFGFIKRNPAVLYSLFLIVFLPLVLWWNTAFTIESFEKNIDLTLQKKALAIENILGEFIGDKISQPDLIQDRINKISEQNPEIRRLRIIVYQQDRFKIIASQNEKEVGKVISDPSISIAWHQKQNIAHLVGTEQERFWKVIKPVYDDQHKKVGLVSLLLSLSKTDALISKTTQISYAVVIISVLVTLVLVLHHTRLFQYLRLYKELQRVDQMKDEFIRMAIHELQTPIVNIKNYVEDLKQKVPLLSPDQKEEFRRISVSAKNLSNLVYDILKVARIEQRALDLSPQKIYPWKITSEVVQSMEIKASAKDLNLEYRKKEFPDKIEVNPNRFREILSNLIDNAIKYTKQGEVKIEEWVDQRRKRYYVSVEDTGIGISGEEQKRLFQKFSRIRNRETVGIPGTGLGLWIVKNLTQKMKGEVIVESMKGVGSKFTVSFSITKD